MRQEMVKFQANHRLLDEDYIFRLLLYTFSIMDQTSLADRDLEVLEEPPNRRIRTLAESRMV